MARYWNAYIGKFPYDSIPFRVAKLGKSLDEQIEDMLPQDDEQREFSFRKILYGFWEWQTITYELVAEMGKTDEQAAKEWKQMLDNSSSVISEYFVSSELQQSWGKSAAILMSKLTIQESLNVLTRLLSFAHMLLSYYDNPLKARVALKRVEFYSPSVMRYMESSKTEKEKPPRPTGEQPKPPEETAFEDDEVEVEIDKVE